MSVKLTVEGAADVAYFTALDCRITGLSRWRDAYSDAHELAHLTLVAIETGANDSSKLVVTQAPPDRILAWDIDKSPLSDWQTVGVASPNGLVPIDARFAPLPTWCTRTFVGLAEPEWFGSATASETGVATQFAVQDSLLMRGESPPLTFRLSTDDRQLSEGIRATLLRIMDALRRMVRMLDGVVRAVSQIRLAVRNSIRHRPNVLAFVLVFLATWRSHGRRSETDGHTLLLQRQLLVSMGSCLQT